MAVSLAPAAFDPVRFFEGRSEGSGSVTIAPTGKRQALRVRSLGRIEAGTLVLDQEIRIGGKTTRRQFRLRGAGPGRWRGSLSGAAGPVTARVEGNRLRIEYPMKGPAMRMRQLLVLSADGRTAHNWATVTMLGVPVARIAERIRKTN